MNKKISQRDMLSFAHWFEADSDSKDDVYIVFFILMNWH